MVLCALWPASVVLSASPPLALGVCSVFLPLTGDRMTCSTVGAALLARWSGRPPQCQLAGCLLYTSLLPAHPWPSRCLRLVSVSLRCGCLSVPSAAWGCGPVGFASVRQLVGALGVSVAVLVGSVSAPSLVDALGGLFSHPLCNQVASESAATRSPSSPPWPNY